MKDFLLFYMFSQTNQGTFVAWRLPVDSIDPVLMACQDCLKGHRKDRGHIYTGRQRGQIKAAINMSVLCCEQEVGSLLTAQLYIFCFEKKKSFLFVANHM